MKYALFGLLVSGASLWAGNQPPLLQPVEFNINSRYTVEAVEVPPDVESRISRNLRQDLQKLIGQKFNTTALNALAKRVRDELHVPTVTQKLMRGSVPDHVKVVLEVANRKYEWELSIPKLLYYSNEGFTAAIQGALVAGTNRISAGLVSDGDELTERYTGVRARYETRKLGTDRVRLRFAFETYHDQWNSATRDAAGVTDLYRTRQNFEPLTTLVLAKPLTLSFGASFERLEPEFPAASVQSSNAAITMLRYRRHKEEGEADRRDLDAGYSLRAATKALNSDFVYARHRWDARYAITRGRHTVSDEFVAGLITGSAPLYERFVLGTSSMLRGWNKYELDPLGGSRLAHNSLAYRYSLLEVFYDSGAIWDAGQDAVLRHSVGVGLRKNSLMVAMAFPVKQGRVTPTLMVGMNY